MASFIIEDWMISERHLGGHELLAFALIHNVTQNGDGCWYGGYDKLASRIGAKQRGTIEAVKSLVDKGLIEKSDAVISGRVRNVLKSTVNTSAKTCVPSAKNAEQIQKNAEQKNALPLQKMQMSSAKNADDNKDNIVTPRSGTDTKVSIPSLPPRVGADAIERIYKLYPTKCPVRGRPTGKSSTDKKKIERLLKIMPEEKLCGIVQRYIQECIESQTPIKNLSTLLNNLPDYDEPELIPERQEEPKNNKPTFTFVGVPRG